MARRTGRVGRIRDGEEKAETKRLSPSGNGRQISERPEDGSENPGPNLSL